MTDEFYPILKTHGNTVELLPDEDLKVYGDVRAKSTGENICISFRNKGKTIPRRRLNAVFGLGLTIAKSL